MRRAPATRSIRAAPGLAQALFVSASFAALTWAYVTSDFSVANVATNSNSQLPLQYKIAASWGSHEGSMLLWVLILALFGFSVVPINLAGAALIVFGVALLAVEGWVTSHGLIGISGVIAICVGGLMLFRTPGNGVGVNPFLVIGIGIVFLVAGIHNPGRLGASIYANTDSTFGKIGAPCLLVRLGQLKMDVRVIRSQPCGEFEVVHRFRCFSLREQELADEVSRISELRALSEHRSKLRNGFLRLSLQFEHRSERRHAMRSAEGNGVAQLPGEVSSL